MKSFTHLEVHSHYSLLNALPKIPELVERAKENEMEALALTDDGALYGAIEFYKECKKADIKPIIGVHFYVATRTRNDKQAGVDNSRYRLILLAKNKSGYQKLIKLVTRSYLEGFYYKPRIDRELIEEYTKNNDDLVAILPTFSSPTSRALETGDTDKATEVIEWYKDKFGASNTFLELTLHPELSGHKELSDKVINLAQDTDTQLVAANEVYYLDPDDRAARETLRSVQSHSPRRSGLEEDDFSFIDQKRANELFVDLPEAVENTQVISDMCNLDLTLGEWVFPKIEIPADTSYDSELRRVVHEGLERRDMKKTAEVEERIEYELDIIKNKGYASYFLVVADLLRFAHENDILTTIRGSVAGSLVTYLAGITNLNPLDYNLRFERFLNPDRPSAPDIDMDFADNRRDEVIDYAREKYGEDNVAQIGTFGTMAARGAVRDVTRALDYSYDLGDRIAKLIPFGSQGFKMTIERALDEEPKLKQLYDSESQVREVIDMSQKIEGCARHIGVHAAGVVISPTKITDLIPLQVDQKKGKLITQYDMHSVEDAGLVKFDFLGLKNLAILSDTIKRIKRRTGEKVDIESIPLDDEKTFSMLAEGRTHSTFQLNGAGMTRYLKDLKPNSIHDINAMVALYRPGPMEFIPQYIARKHNPQLVEYPHPDLENILERSYGLLIYQEDVMLTAIKLAGYSWLEADKFRKAMGKKIPELMAKQEEKFKSGCVENGISEELSNDLWERIKPFAAYAFNKAHSASYGRVAYQTSYMKANYPLEYMAAVLTADSGNVDKIADIVSECQRMGINIMPPDINESFGTFTIIDQTSQQITKEQDEDSIGNIRFGLHSIKNFGEGIADIVISERENNGRFHTLEDFLERVQDRNLNKKTLESLIKCGALDNLEGCDNRRQLLENIDGLLEHNKHARNTASNQDSLFANLGDDANVPSLTLKESPPTEQSKSLGWEKELLGLYISGHPLDDISDQLKKRKENIEYIKAHHKRLRRATVPGLIEEIKVIRTKKGDQMAFLRISDLSGSIEVVVFPSIFEEYEEVLIPETCIVLEGDVSDRNDEVSLVTTKIRKLK